MVRISSDKASHDYYYAEWNGSEWVKTFLANGGGHFHQTANLELCYSGGMAMNPYNPRELYVSIPVSGLNGKKYEIVKMTVGDDGTTTQEAVTSNSGYNNVRPYFIPGSADSPLQLAWMHGNYYDWIVSSSRPDGYPTAIHCDYAWEDAPADLSDGLIAHETFDDIPDGDAYNGQSTATVASGILKTGKQAHAQTSLEAETFTVSLSLQISSEQYYGDILSFGGLGYGLDSLTRKPYVRVGDERHPSTNLLGTSDIWREKGRDTNGIWYEPTKLQFFNLTLTYADGILTTYVNGLLDQQVEATGADLSGTMLIGGFKGWVEDYRTYSRVLNQGEIVRLYQEATSVETVPAASAAPRWRLSNSLCAPGETVRILSDGTEETLDVSIISINGQTLFHEPHLKASTAFRSPKNSGVYLVRVSTPSGQAATCKLVVR